MAAAMHLRYLDFDYSEDDAGHGVFDAMASVRPDQLAALHAEIGAVLGWAHAQFGDPGPLDDDGEWDADIGGVTETSVSQTLAFDPASGRLTATPGVAGPARHTLSLSISGRPAFCAEFRAKFNLDL